MLRRRARCQDVPKFPLYMRVRILEEYMWESKHLAASAGARSCGVDCKFRYAIAAIGAQSLA